MKEPRSPTPWCHADAHKIEVDFAIDFPDEWDIEDVIRFTLLHPVVDAAISDAEKPLVEALKDLFAMMDEDILVRNTDYDASPAFVLETLKTVTRLKKAHNAMEGAGG